MGFLCQPYNLQLAATMAVAMKKASKKTMKAAMKTMKVKRVSKIAKGKYAKSLVLRGLREKTVGGLKKDGLKKNKDGKVVSKAASVKAAKAFRGSALEKWGKALKAARKALGVTGFVTLRGKTGQGKALYAKTKEIYNA